jgi:hypothetical protein
MRLLHCGGQRRGLVITDDSGQFMGRRTGLPPDFEIYFDVPLSGGKLTLGIRWAPFEIKVSFYRPPSRPSTVPSPRRKFDGKNCVTPLLIGSRRVEPKQSQAGG